MVEHLFDLGFSSHYIHPFSPAENSASVHFWTNCLPYSNISLSVVKRSLNILIS